MNGASYGMMRKGPETPGRREGSGMISGVGLDVCEITRMEKRLEDTRFLERFFTEAERDYLRGKGRNGAQTLAGMFAAKEAFAKALGTGIAFELREAEILHDGQGKPEYRLHGKATELAGGDRFHLSISHDGNTAAAVCVRETVFLAKEE